jgi:hypothetical protein
VPAVVNGIERDVDEIDVGIEFPGDDEDMGGEDGGVGTVWTRPSPLKLRELWRVGRGEGWFMLLSIGPMTEWPLGREAAALMLSWCALSASLVGLLVNEGHGALGEGTGSMVDCRWR